MLKIRFIVVLGIVGSCVAACGAENSGTDPETGGEGSDEVSTDPSSFSFFVTSIEAMRQLSGSQNGFGGDLRFGEATGLAGADKICRTIAEMAVPGAGAKTWRAFLSASTGGSSGGPVHAIDRIGEGPWYDRTGRLVASNKAGLLSSRPQGNSQIMNDLPNERGEPNHQGVDNHDTLTGSTKQGQFVGGGMGNTCNDWTSSAGSTGRPMIGHSWPRSASNPSNGGNWMSDHQAPGCAPGVTLSNSGGGGSGSTVGGGGGYGGIYCFVAAP
ncbi:hypothetical protein [Hyalangium versicolor]|uniref:hypothetical protein n=1 Tax=Hyalangium versicolor TaxID=2861190 RepID=UPI001CD023FA|nr:hypothetical protein [Hyalangium versicolor]